MLDLGAKVDSTNQLKKEVIRLVGHYVAIAEKNYDKHFNRIMITFDLSGRCAGRAYHWQNKIRFNWELLLREKDDFLSRTVPHEVAHIIAYQIYGRSSQGHGVNWKRVMTVFGVADIKRCHSYDTKNLIQAKAQKRWAYSCACLASHQISTTLHNKIKKGQKRSCKTCGNEIRRKI